MTDDQEAVLRAIARRAAALPFFADKYAGLDLSGDFAFTDLPEMTREDITAAMTPVAGDGGRSGAYLFTSGGSTAAPKIAWIPIEMHTAAIAAHWRPLRSDDVLANLAMPGRLWSAHYFYNALARHCGADVIGLGHVEAEEWPHWLDFLHRHGTTALTGTPSTLRQVLDLAVATGHPILDRLRTAVFFGEPCPDALAGLCRELGIGLWGNYGSTETWVIGHNGPTCHPRTFHPLPHQHVEVVDGAALITTTHPDAVAPVLRYRVGDLVSWAKCPCGAAQQALAVHGREGVLIKFAGTLVSPQELVELALLEPSVAAAQAVCFDGEPERLEIRVVPTPGSDVDTAALRAALVDSQIDLRFALRGDDDGFQVVVVDRLRVNERTAKTPVLLRSGDLA
ncbi:phenylacetate-CoA ligase [Actinokineospora baliensis]|uniref:AMP-binding protein n=1 Tax=Actinokineospora baliensis TaxID=547056 RepID=UPI00195D6532|nr:AMP-binding protein [Actinokineospora baliensis]MBM7774782.1 phenylacetate-CoA ligase [Actinokineospora baliensis]